MIYFYCPGCDEELEAEESIRGVRMGCPACGRELEVPQVGVKVPGGRTRDRGGRATLRGRPASRSRAKFVVAVLAACVAGLALVSGLGTTISRRVRPASGPGESCSVCTGKGSVACVRCGGSKAMGCSECGGSGTRKNFRDEDEKCFACAGAGNRDCQVCGGAGVYACSGCGGTGRRGGQAAPEPRTFK